MKILITGATGFVGKTLVRKLSENRIYSLVLLSRKMNDQSPDHIKQVISRQPEQTFAEPIPENIDVIIHLAGRAHMLNDQSSNPLIAFREVNVEGTLQLAHQALEKKVKRFIFMSSIGVNGSTTENEPFTESSLPQPHADYAVSKLEAEEALTALFKDSETELVIIRPPLVYAAHAPGNFARLLKLVMTNLPLPFAGTKNKRTFVALDNLVDFIQTCIEHPNAANQTFLVADNESLSTRELVQYLKQGMQKKPHFIYIPQPLMKLGAACLGKSKLYEQLFESLEVDTNKAKKLLGWTAPYSAKQAMLQTGQHYLKMKE
ncbi:NAD-dependent epimerase/dehydratase family protein [Acinetobacter sp. TSRC1-2]|uniref:NAD-dependent epimerase/dehydratase family protein n=1 Tax=unclassified Acinetobacter TaxID=196816 RepID=UPI003CF26F66